MESCGLYVHIPFCKSKCLYCDFPSFCNMEEFISPYIAALKNELQLVAHKYAESKIKTIFIGGGTPTYIHSKHLIDIIDTIKKNYKVDEKAEISIEGNPGTFDLQALIEYRKVGINRLSIGLQAWQDSLLKKLGRIHTQEEFIRGFKDAKTAGFENVNIDLMFGLPGQSVEQWQETLENVSLLQPTHLSCYSLIIEEGTPFYNLEKKGKLIVDEDREREMYYYTKEYLQSWGYNHYEISNFAQPGFECAHNLVYWEVEPYIGVGVSAHSFINHYRYSNTHSITYYIEELSKDTLPIIDRARVSQKQLMEDYMFLGMRKIKGISKKDFFQTFGVNVEEKYEIVLKELLEKKLIESKGNIVLTPKGLDFANYVFQSFL